MNVNELEALQNWLSRTGNLADYNKDLIENAIWCLKNGSDYRAKTSMTTLVKNLKNDGKTEAAKAAEKCLD